MIQRFKGIRPDNPKIARNAKSKYTRLWCTNDEHRKGTATNWQHILMTSHLISVQSNGNINRQPVT